MIPVSPTLLSNPFEESEAILGNILSGRVSAAARGIAAPTTLSPEEKKDVVDRYLGGKPGMMGQILEIATNPMVIVGGILAWRFPIAKADRLLAFGDQIKNYAKNFFPGMRHLHDFRHTFKGPIADWFEYVVTQNHLWNEQYLGAINKSLDKWYKAGGKWDKTVGVRIAAAMDRLDDPNHQAWKLLREFAPGGDRILPRGKSPLSSSLLQLSPAEKELVKDLKGILEVQYIRTLGTKGENLPILGRQLRKMGFEPTQLQGIREGYFPHIETLSRERVQKLYDGWLGATKGSGEAFRGMMGTLPARQVSKRLVARSGWMLPDPEDLKTLGVWNEDLARAYGSFDRAAIDAGKPVLRHYSLDLPKTLENYTRGMARTYSWSVPSRGRKESFGSLILREADKVAQHNIVKANMLKDTYIPLATGQLAWEQAVPSMRFTQLKYDAADMIDKIPGIPGSVKSFLSKPLRESHSITFQRLGSKIQSYFYDTTLVANVTSPLKNLLQHVITTIPVIGPKYTFQGMDTVRKRVPQYFKLLREGVSHENAMKKVFPEFARAGLDLGGVTARERMMAMVEGEEPGIHLPNRARDLYLKARDKGLTLFTGSERFNRLTAFYGAYAKASDELIGTDYYDSVMDYAFKVTRDNVQWPAENFAREVTYMTQFGSGPLSQPYGTTKVWAPLRQYTQFPLRMLSFMMGPGLSLGGDGKLNPGTIGRSLLASGVAYGAGKALLNADLSNALMFGALPSLGGEQSPFGITPLISPFLQVIGSTVSAAARGDIADLQRVAPLLVPGGVQLSRLSTAAAPGIARAINRPWADYESPTPDGRFGVYTGDGSLIGYYSPMQLWAKSIGLGDVQGSTEYALMKYFLGQRDRIRGIRKSYLDAISTGDYSKATAINNEWKEAYPGLGDLQIKKADITAVQMRREVPRLERLLQTLPVESRDMFAQVIATSLGIYGTGLIGIDPGLLGQGTATSRSNIRPERAPLPGLPAGPSGTQSESAQLMTQMGQQRRDELSFSAFSGFGD